MAESSSASAVVKGLQSSPCSGPLAELSLDPNGKAKSIPQKVTAAGKSTSDGPENAAREPSSSATSTSLHKDVKFQHHYPMYADMSKDPKPAFPFAHGKNIYIAHPSQTPLPQWVEQAWIGGQQAELDANLEPLRHKARRIFRRNPADATIERPVMKVSGRMEGGGGLVSLRPTIWIFCGSTKCCDKLRRWVRRAPWASRLEFRLEIQIGTSIWGSLLSSAILPFNFERTQPFMLLGNGMELYAHADGWRQGDKPCNGKLMCITGLKNGKPEWQKFARVGGLVHVGSRPYLTTAAHGMLEEQYNTSVLQSEADRRNSDLSGTESHTDSEDSESDDEDSESDDEDSESDDEDSVDSACCSNTSADANIDSPASETAASQPLLGVKDPWVVTDWWPLQQKGPLNFLGVGTDEHGLAAAGTSRPIRDDSGTAAPPSDFALLTSSMSMGSLYNSHALTDGPSTGYIEAIYPSERMEGTACEVLLGNSMSESAYLLPGEAGVFTNKAAMPTRKIQLDSPLARGTSGSWVVKGKALVGMVVAIYEDQPFAQILPAENLVADIKAAFPFPVDVKISPCPPADIRDHESREGLFSAGPLSPGPFKPQESLTEPPETVDSIFQTGGNSMYQFNGSTIAPAEHKKGSHQYSSSILSIRPPLELAEREVPAGQPSEESVHRATHAAFVPRNAQEQPQDFQVDSLPNRSPHSSGPSPQPSGPLQSWETDAVAKDQTNPETLDDQSRVHVRMTRPRPPGVRHHWDLSAKAIIRARTARRFKNPNPSRANLSNASASNASPSNASPSNAGASNASAFNANAFNANESNANAFSVNGTNANISAGNVFGPNTFIPTVAKPGGGFNGNPQPKVEDSAAPQQASLTGV